MTFLAPPSSGARELLAADPSVAETLYFEHSGSELRRGINLVRLVRLLRRKRFRTIWILDRVTRPAVAAYLAGVPERIGVGLTRQRWFITNSGIDQSRFHDHPIDWMVALMSLQKVPLATTEPNLPVLPDALNTVERRFAGRPRPWIAIGIGAAHQDRDWPDLKWRQLIAELLRCSSGTLFIIGGPAGAARAQQFIADENCARVVNACELRLSETAALLHHAALFVGTDSGPMNIAAAVGTPAFALFGVNPVLTYSKFIHPLAPDGGPSPDGMNRITPAHVLGRLQPYLSFHKDREGI